MNDELNQKTTSCRECGKAFSYTPFFLNGREVMATRLCEACALARREQALDADAAHKAASLQVAWRGICPALYRQTRRERLNQDLLAYLLQWPLRKAWLPGGDGRGVVLLGPTRSGKTRLMFELLRTLHFEHAAACMAISAVSLSECFIQAARGGDEAREARATIRKAATAQVLLIDDLGKERPTPATQTGLYALLEERIAHLRPLFVTSNFPSIDQLVGAMFEASAAAAGAAEDKAAPIGARLLDGGEVIAL